MIARHAFPPAVVAIAALLLGGCTTPAALPVPPLPIAALTCPQWTALPLDRHSNRDSPYLGCTSVSNLRAMLENPADLDHGRPLGPASGARAVRAVETYEQGKIASSPGPGPLVPIAVTPPGGAGTP